jgi:hypothetical protein
VTGTGVINIVITAAILIWVIYQQLRARPLRQRSRVGLILTLIGLIETVQFASKNHVHFRDIGLVIASIVIGAALAVWRAYTVRIWRDQTGAILRQGYWLTALLWLVSIAQHLALDSQTHNGLAGVTLLLYLGISFALQRLVMLNRARRMGLLPANQASLGAGR